MSDSGLTSRDVRALVVPPQQEEVLGVLDLVGQQQADGLERLFAAVDVVAEEEVVGFGREAAVLEQAQEVVVLSVDITADLVMNNGQHGSISSKATT